MQRNIQAPLRVKVSDGVRTGKPRYFTLNLNQYRNGNYHILNKAKVVFKEQMGRQIRLLPYLTSISLTYVVYPPTNAIFDVGNVCSIVDKFFCDALVEYGKLPDDNYKHIPIVAFKIGHIDRENPRVEIKIKDLSTNTDIFINPDEENNMQIMLNEDEIKEAISDYVHKQVRVAEGSQMVVELKAGRGENGFTATLDITTESTNVAALPTKDEPVEVLEEAVVEKPKATRKPKAEKQIDIEEAIEKSKAEVIEPADEEDDDDIGDIFATPAVKTDSNGFFGETADAKGSDDEEPLFG